MSSNTITKTLKSFGLTKKESEVYIFLSKHGVLTGGELSKLTRTHRPHMYRILRNLQKKGVVESTLESPVRYSSVPFERVLDENIKFRQQEAISLEKSKNSLLADWTKIYTSKVEPDIGKFIVIEGNRKIHSKISQLIKETKSQLSAILKISDLARAEQFGVFETIHTHPLKSKIKFQFLTELFDQNLQAIKMLNKKLNADFDLKARNSSASFSVLPRMVVRDNKEILFFISPNTDIWMTEKNEVCIYTNNASLVQTLKGIFEELWLDSTEINKRILEIETATLPTVPYLLNVAKKSKRVWLIRKTIQYYLQALELMKDVGKWREERTETLEALGGLHGLVAEHEKANEFYQKAIESTHDDLVRDRLKRKIRLKRIVENGGVKLSYYVYGTGEPTIFLLSWTATAEMWIPQMAYFSKKYKVVTMDMRGSGESDKPQGEYTIDKHVDDLKSIIDDLGDKNIIFVGSFVGAKIAVKYITRYPGKVTKMVLLSFDPSPVSAQPGFNREKFEEEHEKAIKSPSWCTRKFFEDIIPDPRFESLKEWAYQSSKNTPPEIFVNSLYNFKTEDVRPLLKKIDIPTLLLYGDLTISDLKRVKRLKKKIPLAKTFIFKDVGHCLINMIKANKFNKTIENFVEGQSVK